MKNFVSVDWLKDRLADEQVIPVDCRFDLQNPEQGYEGYLKSHIPGARYANLEKDLSQEVKEHGGRHPLPDVDRFAAFIGSLGIDRTKTVVAYDAQNNAMAARFWWMLKYLGHEDVVVLDGGFSAWKELGYPLTDALPEIAETKFTPDTQSDRVATMEDVKSFIEDVGTVLIDARAEERYLGRIEPIDQKAGHIPSAENRFFMGNLENGKLKSTDQLKQRFERYTGKEIVNYCGSGVTACVNVLALDEIGIKSKLYVGSWSDWSSYHENEIETE